jgi:rfaE bifunctional protein nucleotidyltransferase chain/domain
MLTDHKLLTLATLPSWRAAQRAAGRRVVVTNGVFDLLHVGHVSYLETARSLGDLLLIGVNGDESVRQLKGPTRPLNPEADRERILAALECVSAVCIFPEMRAVNFLKVAQPDIYVKGGDYTLESIDQNERHAVESAGGRIEFIRFVDGKSTTRLVEKMKQ